MPVEYQSPNQHSQKELDVKEVIKDQLNQSYSTLGQRKFSQHTDYLYERGIVRSRAQYMKVFLNLIL
jgi:hypothetical protein